jgi:Protein of unknown function (DUF3467)
MEGQGQQLNVSVPEDQAIGHYANLVGVWHTPHEFAIDFAVVQPFLPTGPGAQVVCRVRIPPTIVFELLKTLNQNLTEYEKVHGEIQRPNQNMDEPMEGGEQQQ